MELLCTVITRPGDEPDHRGTTYAEEYYPWWCRGALEVAVRLYYIVSAAAAKYCTIIRRRLA